MLHHQGEETAGGEGGREGGREAEGENEVKKEWEGRGRNTLISNSQLQFLFELAVILLQ